MAAKRDYYYDNVNEETAEGRLIPKSYQPPQYASRGKQERTPKAVGRCPKCGVALAEFPCLDCQING